MKYERIKAQYSEKGAYNPNSACKFGEEGTLEFSLKALDNQEFEMPMVCH